MLVQDSLNFSIYFYTEGLLIEYFIILILGIELSAAFIFQYVTRRGMSPKWILSFSATAIAFTSAALLYALKDLLFDTPSMRNFTYEMDLIIVSACSVASSYLMYDYFKMRGTRARVLSAGFFVFCVVSTIVSIIELFSTWNIQLLAVIFGCFALIVVIYFPMFLIIQLGKRDESRQKRFLYWLILAGLFILFSGMILNFDTIDETIKILALNTYNVYKIIILAIIIIGLSLIGLSVFYLPPIDDFLWIENLVALYIIEKEKGKALFKKVFDLGAIESLPFSNTDKNEESMGEDMFLGEIGGISDLLSETLIDPNKKIEMIDQGAIKLLLIHENNLIFILLAKQNMPLLNWKLKQFKDTFMLYYGDFAKKFSSKPENFIPVEKIVDKVFNIGPKAKNLKVE